MNEAGFKVLMISKSDRDIGGDCHMEGELLSKRNSLKPKFFDTKLAQQLIKQSLLLDSAPNLQTIEAVHDRFYKTNSGFTLRGALILASPIVISSFLHVPLV